MLALPLSQTKSTESPVWMNNVQFVILRDILAVSLPPGEIIIIITLNFDSAKIQKGDGVLQNGRRKINTTSKNSISERKDNCT